MRKKLSLESLAVDSFPTTAEPQDRRGTVHANGGDECTCVDSCLCPTNAYYCATAPATYVSCQYTYNVSCDYDTNADSCGCTNAGCASINVICVGGGD